MKPKVRVIKKKRKPNLEHEPTIKPKQYEDLNREDAGKVKKQRGAD